ncbi:MAG: HAD family phosphatase [Akkermansiaceae bacterium]|nr:HAD family phosphatase [Akkermansiaceae bacterium]NNM29969.1 HAD family phosphatase [Akkermansiaceae bacterium]
MRAALIDIGNVLLTVDFETPLQELVPPQAGDSEARLRSLLEKKDELESGRLADDAFVAWASDRLGFDGSPEAFRAAWNDIFDPIMPMWEVMHELKDKGLSLILFSNTNRIHADYFLPSYDIFRIFDHAVFSHEVGSIKPDPAIYRHAIETFGLTPAETLYIDDLPENIATGKELGFEAHQYDFRNHEEFLAWLAGRL